MIWVPDYRGIQGNKIADQLAKLRPECPFIGPESASSISAWVARRLSGTGQAETTKDTRYL
jgi:hypothetical protein